MKLLVIARHHTAAMHRKVELLRESHGFDVRYVIPARWGDALGAAQRADPAVRFRRIGFWGAVDDPHRATWRTLDFGMRAFQPAVIVAEEEPDSVAAVHVAAARQVFAPRAKLVLYTWQNVDRPLSRSAAIVRRAALRRADGILCANADAELLLRLHGYGGHVARVPAIGVDTRRFHPCDALGAASPRMLQIGFAGRLLPEGVDTLLAALALLPTAQFAVRVIGGGPHDQVLRARAAELGIGDRVAFVNSVAPERMREALCALDALVLPSISTPVWKEQFGRVLVEAMACGVPVIGSTCGAIPEVIADAGLTFREGDAAALAAQLRRLCDDALRRDLTARGIARVSAQYTQERIATAYADFLRAI